MCRGLCGECGECGVFGLWGRGLKICEPNSIVHTKSEPSPSNIVPKSMKILSRGVFGSFGVAAGGKNGPRSVLAGQI